MSHFIVDNSIPFICGAAFGYIVATINAAVIAVNSRDDKS